MPAEDRSPAAPNLPERLSAATNAQLSEALRPRSTGHVSSVVGLLIEAHCPQASVGDLVRIDLAQRETSCLAEVVGLKDGRALLVSLGDTRGIVRGSRVHPLGQSARIQCSMAMLGRVLDARGQAIDGRPEAIDGPFAIRDLYSSPPNPLERRLITTPLAVGSRVLDGMLTLGRGQRIGIMAGAGVGKSTLMGTLARSTDADVSVIALIGERGREVGEFVHRTLDDAARQKTVVIAATSDRSPLERMRGAFLATAIAEYFAACGKHVLLMMDSLTRFAMAQRELGLSMGEPPTTRGYTPSVFSTLPKLLERAGNFSEGSVTAIYTVLVEGDDMHDPIGDSARSILDGHIVLSRDLAARGHFPAVDPLSSISRVMDAVVSPQHAQAAATFRTLLAKIREGEELVQIGAYVPGADEVLDRALQRRALVDSFLRQSGGEHTPLEQTVNMMAKIVEGLQ